MTDKTMDQIGVAIFKTAPTLAVALIGEESENALAALAGSLSVASAPEPVLGAIDPSKYVPVEIDAKVRTAENFWVASRGAHLPAADRLRTQHDQQSRRHETTARRLAYIVTFGFFLLIAMLLVVVRFPMNVGGIAGDFQSQFRDVLLTMTGVVGTSWAGIISFYFGSSVGSRLQNDTLGQIAQHGTDTTPAPVGPPKPAAK